MIFDNSDLTKDTKINRNEANQFIEYYESIGEYWSFTNCNWNKKTKMKNIAIKNRQSKEVITFYDLYKKYKFEKKITPEQHKLMKQSYVYKEAIQFIFASFLFYCHCSNILHYYPFFGNHRVNKSHIKSNITSSIKKSINKKIDKSVNSILGFKNDEPLLGYKNNQKGGSPETSQNTLLETTPNASPPFFIYGCSGILRFFYGFLSDETKDKYKTLFNENDKQPFLPYSPYLLTPTSKKDKENENENEKIVFDINEIINDTTFIESLLNFGLFRCSYEHEDEDKKTKQIKEFKIDAFDENNIIKSIVSSFGAFNKVTAQYINTAFLAPHRLTFYLYRNCGGQKINQWLCNNIPLSEEEKKNKTFLNTFVFWFAFILFLILAFVLLLVHSMISSMMYMLVFLIGIFSMIPFAIQTYIPLIIKIFSFGGKQIKKIWNSLLDRFEEFINLQLLQILLRLPILLCLPFIAFICICILIGLGITLLISLCIFFFIVTIVYYASLFINTFISFIDNLFIPQATNDSADNDIINTILSKLKWMILFSIVLYCLFSLDSKNIIAPYLYNLRESFVKIAVFILAIIYFYYKSKTWNHVNKTYQNIFKIENVKDFQKLMPFLSLDYYIRGESSSNLFNLKEKDTFCKHPTRFDSTSKVINTNPEESKDQTGGGNNEIHYERVKGEDISSGLKYGIGSIISLPVIAYMKGFLIDLF